MQAGYIGPSDRLAPYRRLDSGLLRDEAPDFAKEKYIHCFLDEPEPASWRKNPEFPGLWIKIMNHILHDDFMAVLTRFDVLPEDDAYVVDWANMERTRAEMKQLSIIRKREGPEWDKVKDATKRYVDSRVPLEEYKGSYSLPELVIASEVMLDRIRTSEDIIFDF